MNKQINKYLLIIVYLLSRNGKKIYHFIVEFCKKKKKLLKIAMDNCNSIRYLCIKCVCTFQIRLYIY